MPILSDIRTAQQIIEASRSYENSGPVNPLLLEQACNIADTALETLIQTLKERDDWKFRAKWWELQKCTEGTDVRNLFVLGDKYLPEELAGDLQLASTTTAWFHRLRQWIDGKLPKGNSI